MSYTRFMTDMLCLNMFIKLLPLGTSVCIIGHERPVPGGVRPQFSNIVDTRDES